MDDGQGTKQQRARPLKLTCTKLMRDALEAANPDPPPPTAKAQTWPPGFMRALRGALDAGMSCEQITAFLVIATGLHEVMGGFDGEELVERCRRVMKLVEGDKDRLEREADEQERYRMVRDQAKSRGWG